VLSVRYSPRHLGGCRCRQCQVYVVVDWCLQKVSSHL